MKRFFWILFVMSLWGHLLLAQEKTVSGIVISTADDEWRNHQRKRRVLDDGLSPYENTASLLFGV